MTGKPAIEYTSAERLLIEREQLRTRVAESEAENDQWQKKLAETWAEIARLKAAVVEIGAAHIAAQAEVERLQQVVESTTRLNYHLAAECVERQQDQERLRAVVEATRTYVFGLPSSGSKYDAVIAALEALDRPNGNA